MADFPELTTERLRLRKPAARDIPAMMEYADNSKISEMTLSIPQPYHEKDAISWINMTQERFEDQSGSLWEVSGSK